METRDERVKLGDVVAINPEQINGVEPEAVIQYIDLSAVSWD